MNEAKNNISSYPVKLDFFWRAISFYLIAALVYAFVDGAFEFGSITIQFSDPVIILLGIFIIISAVSLFFSWYAQREIIVGADYLEFKNRLKSKRIDLKDITSITFGRELIKKGRKTRRLPIRIIKIRLTSQPRIIKLNVSAYQNSAKLLADIQSLKKRIDGK